MDDIQAAIRDQYTRRALTYDDAVMHVELADAVARFLGSPNNLAVLDVATGTGLVLRAIRNHHPSIPVSMTGVDITPRMLEIARSHLPDVEFHEADAAVLPLADASFDLATCVCGLHLIPDTVSTVSEWARVLRPGGRAVTATYTYFDPDHYGPDAAASAECQRGLPPDRHSRFDTVAKLAAVVEPAGFHQGRTEEWTHAGDVVVICEWIKN